MQFPKPAPSHSLLIVATRWIKRLQGEVASLQEENAALRAGQCQCMVNQHGRVLHSCPAFGGNIVAHLDGQLIPLQFRNRFEANAYFCRYDRADHTGECASCGQRTAMYGVFCSRCEADC